MESLQIGNFVISTYIGIIAIAFLLGFAFFWKIAKKAFEKIDIWYIYGCNILGFAIGAKIFSLIENKKAFTIPHFLASGYSFIGGILGSILIIWIYCKKYKIDFSVMLSKFSLVYPFIYAISKWGCFLNGCCGGFTKIPLQLIDSISMFVLFLILFFHSQSHPRSTTALFFLWFGIIRFCEDFWRITRMIWVWNLSCVQIICIIFIVIGVINLKNIS